MSLQRELLEQVLEAYQTEYSELIQNGRNLETKAQGTTAIAGIFLGGLFGFLRDPQCHRLLATLFWTAASTLGCAIVFAALVLLVRTRKIIFLGDTVNQFARDLLPLDQPTLSARLPAFPGDVASVWRQRVNETRSTVAKRGDLLWIAQLLLMLGIILSIAAVFVKLWT